MAIELNWTSNNAIEDEQRIYRAESTIDTGNLPAPIATVTAGVETYTDGDVADDVTYFYRVSSVLGGLELASEEVEILSGAAADVFYAEVMPDSPIVYWTMDGTGIADEIGSNDLVFSGGVLTGQPGIVDSGDSIYCDGVDDAAIGSSVLSTLTLPITIESVCNLESLAALQVIATTNGANPASSYAGVYFMVLTDGTGYIRMGNGTTRRDYATAAGVIPAGVNIHAVARVEDVDTVFVFVNGTKYPTTQVYQNTTGITFSSGLPTVGHRVGFSTSFCPGNWDDTAIYNSGLSDARIAAHYAATGI